MSALDYDERRQQPNLGALLGFRFVHADETEAIVEADPTEEHRNLHGMIHGGFLAALLDTATGWAIHARLPESTPAVHVQLSVQYVRAGVLGVPLVCRATALGVGRRIGSTEAVITQGGKVIARGSGTHAVLEPRQA